MQEPSQKKLVNVIRKYRLWLAISGSVILMVVTSILAYNFSGDSSQGGQPDAAAKWRAVWLTAVAILINLLSTIIAFAFASMVFSKEDEEMHGDKLRSIISEAMNVPVDLGQVPWTELIENAAQIDFVVQGWNGWAANAEISKALTRFFDQGGKFRLYVCSADAREGSIPLSLMEQRIGKTPGDVVYEINNTFVTINEAREQIEESRRAASSLEQFQTSHVNWYFAAAFKPKKTAQAGKSRDTIVFSIYSHTSGRRPWDMPALVAYPDRHPGLSEWFDKELNHLRAGARKAVPVQPAGPNRDGKEVSE